MLHTEVLEPRALGILKDLMELASLKPFCLVGGTALALQFGHRLSVDLDLFTPDLFDKEVLMADLRDYIGGVETNNRNKIGMRLTVQGIKVDLVTYRYPLLSPYVTEEGVRMFALEDIASMKLAAITNRGAKKDFYDIYELISRFGFSQLCHWYQQKYTDTSLFMMLKSVTYFQDADQFETPVLINQTVSWNEVKASILKAVTSYS
jgi:predicted nucleotidyltransferase component of viral defense system